MLVRPVQQLDEASNIRSDRMVRVYLDRLSISDQEGDGFTVSDIVDGFSHVIKRLTKIDLGRLPGKTGPEEFHQRLAPIGRSAHSLLRCLTCEQSLEWRSPTCRRCWPFHVASKGPSRDRVDRTMADHLMPQ